MTTDSNGTSTERSADSEVNPDEAAIPLHLRVLGGLGLVALLVAIYSIVQLTSGSDVIERGENALPAAPGAELLPPESGEPPKIGAAAPDFTVPTLDGGTFSLRRHLAEDGRPVFLNMWAEWCFPCRTEMPAIDEISREHPEVHFIGVVIRDREGPARRFVEEYGITYEIGLDAENEVLDAYFVWAMPSTYLIGRDGVIIERIFGPMQESELEELVSRATVKGA